MGSGQVNDAFGHWFAGFADGEGCFTIPQHEGCFTPAFCIALRADDRPLLVEISETLGIGRLYDVPRRPTEGRYREPRCDWRVYRRSDVLSLVEIFDRFPLRSKKARDYETWRVAALLWGARATRRVDQQKLAEIKLILERDRKFVSVE